MAGKKGRSGRLPKAVAIARANGKDVSLAYARRRLSAIVRVVVDMALEGDKEAAIYCIDRVLGRPRIELDTKSETTLVLDPSLYLAALRESQAVAAPYQLEADSPAGSGHLHNRLPDSLCLCPPGDANPGPEVDISE